MAEMAPHAQSWKTRACPGKELFWSFSLRPSNVRVRIRRLSMWTILLLRIIVSISQIIWKFFGASVFGTALAIALAILNLVFITWCLCMIDRAEGYRHVTCLRIGRSHLDTFLHIAALFHVMLVVFIFTWWWTHAVLVNIMWFTLSLLIAVYGLITSRLPSAIA